MGKMKITQKGIYKYLFVYSLVLLTVILSVDINFVAGENASYALPTVSFFNDGNFVLSEEDWQIGERKLPEWKWLYQAQNHTISGVYDENGEQLTWYFPIYSAYCVPFYALCEFLNIPLVYSYRIANFVSLIILLLCVAKYSKYSFPTKFMLVLALSIHPILLIMKWASAEVFLYCLLAGSVLLWLHKRHKLSGLLCAIAGMMNNTILFWGIVMIIDYMLQLLIENYKEQNFFKIYLSRWKQILLYAICYIPALVPMAYFYKHTGHITIQHFNATTIDSTFWRRVYSYLVDLNFGILPYFLVFLSLALMFVVYSLVKEKNREYICLICGFLGVMLCYSIHGHINCGMEGISRYNAWNSVFLCIGVPFCIEKLISDKKRKILYPITGIGVVLTGLLAFFVWRGEYNYIEFHPIAQFALKYTPGIYNPMPSTFNSRVNHMDGGYNYNCPIYYYDDEGYVRKILVSPDTIDEVKDTICGNQRDVMWLEEKLYEIRDISYVSIGQAHRLKKGIAIKPGDNIYLSGSGWNAEQYIQQGISGNENTFTWTDGHSLVFNTFVNSGDEVVKKMIIHYDFVYSTSQRLIVKQNNVLVGEYVIEYGQYEDKRIEIPIDATKDLIDIVIEFPNAVSPSSIGEGTDGRMLAVGLTKIEFE